MNTKRMNLSLASAKLAGDGKTLTGYGSVFGNVDLDKDIIDHGAFSDDLDEFVRDGFLGWMHDWGDASGPPVGYFAAASEDDHGLLLSARFHSHALAEQVRSWVAERLAAGKSVGLSIGFRILGWERDAAGIRHITKAKLYEVSVVTVPANPQAQVTGLKSASPARPAGDGLLARSLAVRSSVLRSAEEERRNARLHELQSRMSDRSISDDDYRAATAEYLALSATTNEGSPAVSGLTTSTAFSPAGAAVIDQRGHVLDDAGPGAPSAKAARAIASTEYKDAYRTYLRKGQNGLSSAEIKVLQEGVDEEGGFLVPADMAARIIARAPTPTRLASRVTRIPTNRDRLRVPKVNYSADDIYSTGVRAHWTGEVPSSSTVHRVDDPAFGQIGISVYTAMLSIELTTDMVEDSAFPVLGWVADRFAETYGLLQDEQVVSGTGIGRPAGILLNPGGDDQPAIVNSGGASTLTADGLQDIAWSVPEQYDDKCAWVFKKTSTGAAIAKLKDANDRYLWASLDQSGLVLPANQRPLLGYPTLFSGFMPNVAADAFPIIFGDLSGYFLVERVGLSIQVLREVYAESGKVVVLGRARFGGLVAEPWKLRVQKVAAA